MFVLLVEKMKPICLIKWAVAALLLLPPFCFGPLEENFDRTG